MKFGMKAFFGQIKKKNEVSCLSPHGYPHLPYMLKSKIPIKSKQIFSVHSNLVYELIGEVQFNMPSFIEIAP